MLRDGTRQRAKPSNQAGLKGASRGYMSRAPLAVLFAIGVASAAINDPVHLDNGLVSGLAGKSPEVRVFKGLPFAAPPVGNLRWASPKPPAHWDGVRQADEFGQICMQGAAGG